MLYPINQMVEKSFESNVEVHIIFINFKKVFDILKEIHIMRKNAYNMGIPTKLITSVMRTPRQQY